MYKYFIITTSLIISFWGCNDANLLNQPMEDTAIEVTLTEGTNMALSLSPDKKQIVFDLQGRLWILPIQGGLATAITDLLGGCHAPHWSPDGEWIAFHSYRDGNFHIWRIRPDGTGLEQLTKGLFDHREPYWGPDSKSIYFASDRNGSYDIFKMDLSSREVIIITDDQPDNEYYPLIDDTDIAYFVKNDRFLSTVTFENNQIQNIFSSSATLGTPSLHPSGDHVIVQGLREAKTFWLSIDMEGAIVDTIPCTSEDIFPFRPAWVNESEFLYTADGQILILNTQTRDISPIPFEAKVGLQRPDYTRRTYDFDDASSQGVLGIRNPVLSQDGQQVVFTALGDLWMLSMDGELQQLTNDAYVDLDPVFSSDDRYLAFVSDRSGSMNIWLMDMQSLEVRQVSNSQSDLMYPSWSPDDQTLAYVNTSRLNVWGRSTLHTIDIETGDTQQIFDQIFVPTVPQWSPDGESIWLAGLQPNSSRFREGKTHLLKINISDNSYQYMPIPANRTISTRGKNGPVWSPNGKYLAMVLEGELHIQEMDENQQPIGVPIKLIDGLADVPSWSKDGKQLLVLATDQLVKVSIEGETTFLSLDMKWERSLPGSQYIIQAGKIFNGLQSEYLEGMDIWVKGNRIDQILPKKESYPEGWELVDASELTVIPGLFEMHVHQSEVVGEDLGRIWLAYGITSLREVGANPYDVIARKEAWASGKRPGPRQFYTGGLTDGNRIYYGLANSITNEKQLNLELERAVQLKYDLIKTYVRMPDVWQQKVVVFAHEHGIPVSSHELYPAVTYGVDAVEHLLGTSRRGYSLKQTRLQKVYDDVTLLLASSGMSISPTLGLGGGIVPFISSDPSLLDDPLYQHFFDEASRNSFEGFMAARQRQGLAAQKFTFQQQKDFIRELVTAGGVITAGTDAPFLPYGWALHAELEIYADAGLSPFEVLQTSTYHAAKSMGLAEHLGTIEEGKLADMVLVSGDPLSDISDARKVIYTMKNGALYDSASLKNRP